MDWHEVDEFCSVLLHLNYLLAPVGDLTAECSFVISDHCIWVWTNTLGQLVEARKAIGGEWEAVKESDLPRLEQRIGRLKIILMAHTPMRQPAGPC